MKNLESYIDKMIEAAPTPQQTAKAMGSFMNAAGKAADAAGKMLTKMADKPEKPKGLGTLYTDKTGILKHREWRGVGDTAYDFYRWLYNWKDIIDLYKSNPKGMKDCLMSYRWSGSYLTLPAFMDRHTMGLKGTQLKLAHESYNMIMRNFLTALMLIGKVDQHLVGDNPIAKRIIVFDELIPSQLWAGFPTLLNFPLQSPPLFFPSMLEQSMSKHYLDAVENFGVPADVCPLPSAEAGMAVEDDYPAFGMCYIACNMPCDGSAMTSSFQERRLNMPTYVLNVPVRYDEDESQEYAVAELKKCIEYVENLAGVKYDYNALKAACERYNEQTEIELEKWEYNRTDYPQFTGANLWLFRMFSFAGGALKDPRYLQVERKTKELMEKAYARKEKRSTEIRHRAIIWSCPANYYTDFPLWLENCWGICGLMDMETNTSTIKFDTSSPESMLRDMAYHYERAIMRKHTKGGYAHVLDELWKQVDLYHADMVIMYDQISCKGMDGLVGDFEDQAKERGVRMIWVKQDLMDCTTISRRDMREDVNKFMYTVMQEEPLDPSLVDFDDSLAW